MQFDKGFMSPYMVNNTDKMECVLSDCYILITDKKIKNLNEILPVLESVSSANHPLLIIAEDIETEVLSTLVLNKLRGALNVCAVKAPGYADKRKALCQDIAVLTGGTFICEELGLELSNTDINKLGYASLIKVNKDTTTISGGKGSKEDIDARANEIRGQISACDNDFDRNRLSNRLAKLLGGIAVICVGSATEVEMQEKKLRIEDAIEATKSAVEEGIVSGGGIALLRASTPLQELITTLSGDEKTGAEIVLRAISAPIKMIANNAGVDGGVIIDKILNSDSATFGYNALTHEYVDMIDAGVIDPTKVTRSAIENAGSVAATLLTTEVIITDIEDKTNNASAVAQGHGIY